MDKMSGGSLWSFAAVMFFLGVFLGGKSGERRTRFLVQHMKDSLTQEYIKASDYFLVDCQASMYDAFKSGVYKGNVAAQKGTQIDTSHISLQQFKAGYILPLEDSIQIKMTYTNPPLPLLVKLGSLIVHYQELNSPESHPYDQKAIDSLENDPEVVEWLKTMDQNGFLPKKRN